VIVGYARVSTVSDEQKVSVEAQVQQLLDAGCQRVIREQGSAFKESSRRPGWEELQGLVAQGAVTKVVAISQSRLSRREDVLTFLRICARKGVEVQFLDGSAGDVADPAGLLMSSVMAAVNEVDSLIKSINIKNGIQRRRAAGHYASGRVPFGYRYDGRYVVCDPVDFPQAQLLWTRLEESEFNFGRTIRQFGYDWSIQGLRRWAINPILRGQVPGQLEPPEALITTTQYSRVAALLEGRRLKGCRAPRQPRLLSGVVRCQSCQRSLYYVMAHGKPRLKCCTMQCDWWGRGIAEAKLRKQILDALRQQVEPMARLAATPEPGVTPQELERQERLAQLLALREQGVPNLEAAIEALERQAPMVTAALAPRWDSLAAILARPGVLEASTDEELRALVLEFVDEVVYLGNSATVEVRLR
jgi:DNA invertase Pin-like site-specific DNA recombinase